MNKFKHNTMKKLAISVLIAMLSGCNSGDDSDNSQNQSNNAPVAWPDSATVFTNTQTEIDVTNNDKDADGDAIYLQSSNLVSGKGEHSITDSGKLLFVSNQIGIVRIEYTISDNKGGSSKSYVDIDVKEKIDSTTSLYAGTDTCLKCHSNKSSFKSSGHNFELNKVVDDKAPSYPYHNIDGAMDILIKNNTETSLGTKVTGWSDIGYVVGGYLDYMQFTDKNGYVLGAWINLPNSIDNASDSFTSMEYPYASNYDCGACHTTGWKAYTSETGDLRNRNRQDEMPNMVGTFDQAGIQCEACHGAGKAHASKPSKSNITKIATLRLTSDLKGESMAEGKPVACVECHTYDGRRNYPNYISNYNAKFGGENSIGGRTTDDPFSGGRLAADALLGVDPDTGIAKGKMRHLNCMVCHDPHKSTHNKNQTEHLGALRTECRDCHEKESFTASGHENVPCTTCHMPNHSHLFKIDLSKPSDDAHHFDANGKIGEMFSIRQPWNRPVDSCKSCHKNDFEERAARVSTIHGN